MGIHYEQLSLDERCEIYRLMKAGQSCCEIGRCLGRSASTISRELRRNGGRKVGYQVSWAMTQARARRCRRLYKLECSSALRDLVFERLAMGWSPAQIAGRLERDHGTVVISHESIYRYIYWRVDQKENLHRHLPRGKYRRGWRGRKGGSSAHYIKDRTPVHARPKAANVRAEPGHWEADLMSFSLYGQVVLVACERASRLLLINRQPSKAAGPVADALTAMLRPFPKSLRRSMTFDNGSEFAQHTQLAKALKLDTYFCDPRAPWQKGSVENAIGRLRRDLPRKTDLEKISQEDLDEIAITYNMTPRKCLGFQTPLEAFINFKSNPTVALET
jgi:IS30 family transposase